MCSSNPGLEGSIAYLIKIFGLKPKGKRRKGEYIYIAYIKIQSNHTDWLFLQCTLPMLALASGRPVLQH